MLKKISKLIIYGGVALASLSLHILIKTIFPFPLDHLNIIMLAVIWINVFNPEATLFEIMIIPLLLLELFASTPYGLNTSTLLVSCFLIRWFVLNIFTNYSLYMVVSVAFLNLLCYRIIWYSIATLLNIFSDTHIFITSEVLRQWFYEILMTGFLLILLYIIMSRVTPYFKPNYIKRITNI